MLPLMAISQNDFESRYLKIDAATLPAIEEISSITLYTGPNIYSTKLKTFQMNAQNYRQQVDMMAVMNRQSEYLDLEWEHAPKVRERKFGFSVSVDGNNSWDGFNAGNALRNPAYQEMRNFYWCAPTQSAITAGKRN